MTAQRGEKAAERADARARRRAALGGDGTDTPREGQDGATAKHAARTAAAAAAVGAAAGALRAIAGHDHDGEDAEPAEEAHDDDSGEPDEQERAPEAAREREGRRKSRERPPRAEPASADDLRRVAQRARTVLQELRGLEPESLSALRRTPNGWSVTLEVVELHRVPESTDVLASYVVELDDDGGLVQYERGRRYHRSQGDGGDR